MYLIAVIMFLLGFLFISLGQISSDNAKDISELLADNKNIQETKGSLQDTVLNVIVSLFLQIRMEKSLAIRKHILTLTVKLPF